MDINSTTEILEVFQQCRDAGEQIDLFEALAWRDEPPIEAFVEIVQRIKLEPVLALTVQAFGWVKKAEILEHWKENDELLKILSDLAKSGETDLIRWSAAWTIKLIGFDFISTSQYLTETPDNIARNIINRREQTESIKKDSVDFWIYGRTDLFWASKFCANDNVDSVEKVKEIYESKGVRGINEVNLLLIELFRNNIPDVFNLTLACQKVSERRLLSAAARYSSPRELKVLMFNQILCVSSHHAMVRRFAVKFLCSNDCPSMSTIAPNLEEAVNRINDITNEINNIIVKEVRLDENYIDNYDIETITKTVLEDFELKTQSLGIDTSNELKKRSNLITRKQQEKGIVTNEIKEVSEIVAENKNSLLVLVLCSPIIMIATFCASYIPCFFIVALICLVSRCRVDLIPFINALSILAGIVVIVSSAGKESAQYNYTLEKKSKSEKTKNKIEFEESEIKKQIQQIEDQNDIEMEKILGLKNAQMIGIHKIERLLNKRNTTYEIVSKPIN